MLFLLYTVFLTVAAYHGFGQDVWVLGIDEAVTAVEHEMIGISFVIIGQSVPVGETLTKESPHVLTLASVQA